MTAKPFAIIDVETTGTNPLRDRVIEIAVIRTDGAGEFSTLVNPGRSLPPFITSLTGISAEELIDAPRFEEIAPEIADLLEGAVFVAHNARFDYAFVRNEFRRIGISFSAPTLCTVRLSRKLYPKVRKHNLESIIERHAIAVEQRHRALDDARAVETFLAVARAEKGEASYCAALVKLLKIPSLPAGVPEEMVRDLPDAPGVYLFYGKQDEILYVGKSVNIRERVLSHFAGDHGSAKELSLCSQVSAIEARRTPGELSALLLESELVKELAPVYNRRLRKRRKVVMAALEVTEGGYETVRCAEGEGTVPDGEGIIACFRTRRQADEEIALLAKAFDLCPKLLGIEKGKGACFSFQLKRCRGWNPTTDGSGRRSPSARRKPGRIQRRCLSPRAAKTVPVSPMPLTGGASWQASSSMRTAPSGSGTRVGPSTTTSAKSFRVSSPGQTTPSGSGLSPNGSFPPCSERNCPPEIPVCTPKLPLHSIPFPGPSSTSTPMPS
jgi:DNA polymerase-3 subunit epsilon